MKTKLITIDGVELVVRDGYEPKFIHLDNFPSSCGAGDGIGNKLVPDKLLGLRVSASCDIHDDCFEHADATWAEFHQCSNMFIRNLIAIILSKSNFFMKFARMIVASFYFVAVDSIGSLIFKAMKKAQGLVMEEIETLQGED